MKIIPERVTILPDAARNELTVIMEGFRLTLSAEEARMLSYALVQGAKLLSAEVATASLTSGTSAALPAHKPAAAPSFSHEAASMKSGDAAGDVVRSLSA